MNATEKSRTDAHQITRPPRSHARVSVVIPTLNEAANLPHVFARLPFEELFEIILVDGHSTDDTIEIARQLCPSVRVLLQDGKGKGNALACGFAAVRGDIIVMLDADGSTDPQRSPLTSTRCSMGRTSPRGLASWRAAVASTSRRCGCRATGSSTGP